MDEKFKNKMTNEDLWNKIDKLQKKELSLR